MGDASIALYCQPAVEVAAARSRDFKLSFVVMRAGDFSRSAFVFAVVNLQIYYCASCYFQYRNASVRPSSSVNPN